MSKKNKTKNTVMRILFHVLIIPTIFILLVGVLLASFLAIPAFSVRRRSFIEGVKESLELFTDTMDFLLGG